MYLEPCFKYDSVVRPIDSNSDASLTVSLTQRIEDFFILYDITMITMEISTTEFAINITIQIFMTATKLM